jgi:hypothetical protein
MALWLLIPAAFFTYLAFDAWRLRAPAGSSPYAIEASVRGEPVSHVPLHEQARRQAWTQRFGIGNLGGMFVVWTVLAVGCLVGALTGAFA